MKKQIITLTVSLNAFASFDEAVHEVNTILAKVGCKGGYEFVDEATIAIRFNLEFISREEVEKTIGRFILAGFQVIIN